MQDIARITAGRSLLLKEFASALRSPSAMADAIPLSSSVPMDETRIPLSDFREALAAQDGTVSFPEALGAWVTDVQYTPGGGVDVIVLGGRPFQGTWLRKRFGLRSTAFTLELTDAEAVFTTKGYGHRVGMSQYGADAMARAGSSFEEILKWYYQGVELRPAREGFAGTP